MGFYSANTVRYPRTFFGSLAQNFAKWLVNFSDIDEGRKEARGKLIELILFEEFNII
jgi:hypothetical protein